ncbi:GGDEF domain-containing protein [Lachnospira pectinoschiza]|uniref:Diguanylate cyclase (GGDEF) domain-containing protein n=1 Tax=Lachnospira pectinoschiza TaxID=28052 RepID=A0A1G9WHZ3_9FIRM|nr:GGDEF domain-containing protein [Lachnospira pectinoschiza]SDM83967.1 diguanylate cyclase (GGDEF) domain-containing protein [Lachnospira pectinoschiza]
MEFKKDLRDFYNKNTDLNEKIYINVISISSFLTLATSIITLIEGSGLFSSLIVFISFIIMAVVGYLSFHLKKVKLGKLVYTYLFCCVLLPFIYLTCGGIDSGSPLYMLTSFFLIALLLEGIQGIVCLVVTLIVHIFVLWLPYFEMHSLFDTSILSKSARYFDNTIALIAAGIAIFCLTLMTLNAYRKEHEKNNQLVLELQKTSIMDELSGLYNRRHLYSVLFDLYANIEDNGNYYIAMYDLDNFKKINDTYGHLFGDKVLIDFSNKLRTSVNEEIGELASRYGGEEFMCLYRAKDFEQAYLKAESIRTSLENTKWKDAPNLIATVSIGLVACHKFNDMNSCLKGVDDLLYSAKTHGKNKIVYRK